MPDSSLFVDRMGGFFADAGVPRIAERHFAWLLMCDPPEQDAAQLARAVDASAGSISTMLRLLVRPGFVERRGQPRTRKHWCRGRPDAFTQVLIARLRRVTVLRDRAGAGLREIGSRGRRADRLKQMRDFYAFFDRELPALAARY